MKRPIVYALTLAASLAGAAPPQPKLVVGIVVDQFRYDYLTRFRQDYKGGLARLIEQGALFTNAHQAHVPTVSSIGHATLFSGATPAMSGIAANEWYDREARKTAGCVSDDATSLIGGAGKGSSPRQLLVSTLGDELKISGKGGKVIAVSLADRNAILLAGRMADAAYWFDISSGNFVSSTYYLAQLPIWVDDFNRSRPADKFGAKSYKAVISGPAGNDLLEQFAERTIEAERLGKHEGIDLLGVSFSANDAAGHAFGPDSPQVREMTIDTDRVMGKLFRYLDAQVGTGNVLIVMIGDHGVAPVPEVNQKRRMPGGRLLSQNLARAAGEALDEKYGHDKWVVTILESGLYLNRDLIQQKKLDLAEVEETAAQAIRRLPHVFRVYTGEQLFRGQAQSDPVGLRVERGYNATRSGDLIIIEEPYWVPTGGGGTAHLSPFDYDSHVPLVFLGEWIKPGRYYAAVTINDVAPTLATLLDVEIPSGSTGRVLEEILAH